VILTLNYFQCLLDRSSKNCLIADLDYRPLDQIGISHHIFDHLSVRRFRRDFCIDSLSQQIKWPTACFLYERAEILLRKWLVKVVDLVVINAVFTKQRRQIAACRSGRLFVNGDLFSICHISLSFYLIPVRE